MRATRTGMSQSIRPLCASMICRTGSRLPVGALHWASADRGTLWRNARPIAYRSRRGVGCRLSEANPSPSAEARTTCWPRLGGLWPPGWPDTIIGLSLLAASHPCHGDATTDLVKREGLDDSRKRSARVDLWLTTTRVEPYREAPPFARHSSSLISY